MDEVMEFTISYPKATTTLPAVCKTPIYKSEKMQKHLLSYGLIYIFPQLGAVLNFMDWPLDMYTIGHEVSRGIQFNLDDGSEVQK